MRSDWRSNLLIGAGWLAIGILLVAMGSLLGFLLLRGFSSLNLALFFGDTAPLDAIRGLHPVWDGIWPACVGTLLLVLLTVALALFPGIGCGIWLAEYASARQKRWLGSAIDILAGMPSIVMGLFGFTLILLLRDTVLPGANTSLILAAACLALLVLPGIVLTTREALSALPDDLRLTGAALGFSQRQQLRFILLPAASRGILGGILLACGRAAEDTAVILLTGVVASAGLAQGLFDKFQALPFTIYYTAAQYQTPQELERGFGAALVLLLLSAGLLLLAWGIERSWRARWQSGTAP
ncbi:PstA family ABC transporter permease [Entomohabitans teleogrylli]|uniref:PstA family ABC transporter permease n=1 Tax=Entomohabitans teleogrylli TaxID=1384589 RepID=UPI00073D6A6B|nr:ABC transporter permease subunit [Entomohabitans teleogrylli]